MTGLNCIHALSKDAIVKLMAIVYKSDKIYDIDDIEDIILFTDDRVEYSYIGTDKIYVSTLRYITDYIYWINVCLFVNEDFRSCFEDAIMIERTLLQVNDVEYEDFRDDMTLEDAVPGDKEIDIALNRYDDKMEGVLQHTIDKGRQKFFDAGMTEVYDDLLESFSKDTLTQMQYIIHNMIYVINAMNRNGVFKKYVNLVVASVIQQLGGNN